MKGGFKLYATLGFLLIALFYLIYPVTKNERPLNLGLDLQGGMQVTLEVGLEALVRDLATDRDEQFDKVLRAAGANAKTSDVDVIATFVQEFEKRDANVRLSRYFRNTDEGITRKSTNAEIQTYLNTQADKAMDAAIKIVRDRVDRFGVAEPSIVKQGTRRISVELPGVANADRVRKLLRGTAQLQFHLMADQNEVATSLEKIVAFYRDGGKATPADTSKAAKADTTKRATPKTDNAKNPLLAIFTPVGGTTFGVAAKKDTAKVAAMLRRPEVRALMPAGVVPMWAVQPSGEPGKEVYNYLAVRSKVELKGDYITNADTQFDQFTNAPEVSLTMDSEGAGIWSRLTGANVGKQVAITMDNVVYSYPVINEKIPGGRTSINGMGNVEEAKDLVTVLQSGSLPAPVTIVQERTVGPSLGAASIEAGKWSVIISFIVIGLFMMFYYRLGGVFSVIALILNVLFLFGILASFSATLTLPGIAGIVLTMGMAVDANVLVFERIREELDHGKNYKLAVHDGYAKALSAILDSNITTFLSAAILYSFGIGPIKGFAVTLMAGIATTLFTSLVVTRMFIEWYSGDGKRTVSYG